MEITEEQELVKFLTTMFFVGIVLIEVIMASTGIETIKDPNSPNWGRGCLATLAHWIFAVVLLSYVIIAN